jgi:SAM-dependent methyltransferase
MKNLEHQLLEQRRTARTFFWHRVRWTFIKKRFRRAPVSAILDIGAGSGIFSDFVKRHLPKTTYYFVEPSVVLSDSLRREYGSDRDLGKAENYAVADVVILLDVLEHIVDDKAFIADLVSKLKPGATFILTVPAMKSLWSGWDPIVGHHRRYSRAEILEIFGKHAEKFEVLDCQYLFWELIPLALYRKWKLRSAIIGKVDPLKESEVPALPAWVNQILFVFSRLALILSRWIPAGTSLALVGVRK